MRLFHCNTCGADLLKSACPHHPHVKRKTELVCCAGFGCTKLVENDPNHASWVALGSVCCSLNCYITVYNLENYVDEEAIIDLPRSHYRVITTGPP